MKKLLVDSSSLKNAMQVVKKVMNKKSVLPILECFHCAVQITDNSARLILSATDLENSIIASMPCEAMDEFKFLIHLNDLGFIIQVDEQPLTFEVDETTFQVAIFTESEKVVAVGENHEDFPIIPHAECEALASLDKRFFTEIKTTLKYVLSEKRDPNIKYKGIGTEITEAGIDICGTNSTVLRLTTLKAEINKEAVGEKFLLNPSFCKLISSFKKADNIELAIMKMKEAANTVLTFNINRMQIKLIGRNYDCALPDYKAVIPTYSTTTVSFNTRCLQNKVCSALPCANQSTFQGIFHINSRVQLTAQDVDSAKQYQTEFTHNGKEGEDIDISFNLSLVSKVLSDTKSDSVTMDMTTATRAVVIKEENSVTLLMPMQIAA